jgi:hypothetical protein
MTRKITDRERQGWQLAAMVAIRLHPGGIWTTDLADALQITQSKTVKILKELEIDGRIEKRSLQKPREINQFHNLSAKWFIAGTAPGYKPPARLRTAATQAPHFEKIPDFDEEFDRWMAAVTRKKVRPNPWGPG